MQSKAHSARLGVVWEGSFFVHHSLANVNREVAVRLARANIDLGLLPFETDQFHHSDEARYRRLASRMHRSPTTVHCHVRHRWPPRLDRPARGAFVLVQPWEFGSLPQSWTVPLARVVDEAWVHTNYVRDVYLRSGIDPRKVHLIPLGVNARLFHPGIRPSRLPTRKRFRFLFVGGAILRKGFDILLRAYVEEFTSADDVCLVVKDFFYGGEAARDVARVQRNPDAPEILYTYGTSSYHRLGGLYTACDCYVHPYRSEGFGLPIAEAMACGLPVIVTGWGAALDFCGDETAYLIPAVERRVPDRLWDQSFPTVHPPTWSEPDRASLRRLMRYVLEHRDEARRKGALASAHIRRHVTWAQTVAGMIERMERYR